MEVDQVKKMESLLLKARRYFCFSMEDAKTTSVLDNLSLGTGDAYGRMNVHIPRNVKIPFKVEKAMHTTATNNQPSMVLKIYEGESLSVYDNTMLKELVLNGISPAPKGVTKVEVCFEIDANGTLKVSAEDKIAEVKSEILITSAERESINKAKAMKDVETLANKMKDTLGSSAKFVRKLTPKRKEKIEEKVSEVIEWLDKNKSAKVKSYKAKLKELEVLWNPIITKMYVI